MSLNPATYAEALERAQKRPRKPRTPLRPRQGLKTSLSRRNAPRQARKKLTPLPKLHKKVWREFSIYIRSSVADEFGMVQCVTCPNRLLWNSGQIQAGHWMHGRLDFDERNVHPQCVPCNYHWNTKVNSAYAIYMARTYGVEGMEELQLSANQRGNRYSRAELDELLVKYKGLNKANLLVRES